MVHVDSCLLAVPLGNADAHRRAQPGCTAVLEQPTCDDSVPDEVELRLYGNPRKAHCGALFEIPEDREGFGSGVDVSFDTRSIAVRHIFHQFGDVEARQGPLDRLSDLEERLTRAYGDENAVELGRCRLWGYFCVFHWYFSFEFKLDFVLHFDRCRRADQ